MGCQKWLRAYVLQFFSLISDVCAVCITVWNHYDISTWSHIEDVGYTWSECQHDNSESTEEQQDVLHQRSHAEDDGPEIFGGDSHLEKKIRIIITRLGRFDNWTLNVNLLLNAKYVVSPKFKGNCIWSKGHLTINSFICFPTSIM